MKNTHQEMEQLLARYLDGELDEATSGRVEEHLVDCESCRNHLADLNALHAMVREKDTPPKLAEDYWDWHRHQVWRRIRTERHERLERSSKQRFLWLRMASVAAGAAAVLIAVVGGWRLLVSAPGRHPEPMVYLDESGSEFAQQPRAAGGLAATGKAHEERSASRAVELLNRPSIGVYRMADEENAVTGADHESKDGDVSDALGVKGGAGEKAEGWMSRTKSESAGGKPVGRGPADEEARFYGAAREEAVAEAELESREGYVRGAAKARPPAMVLTTVPTLEDCDEPPELVDIQRLPSVLESETATVYVRALVETDGLVSEVEVERSSGIELLDTIALMNVRQARFRSGQNEGKAVRCWVSLPQSFEAVEDPAAETDSIEEPPQEQ